MSFEIGWEKFKFPDEPEEDEDDFEEDTEYDDDEDGNQLLSIVPQQINPFFQLKKYNLWTGHTNFKISKTIAIIINNELGVETLDVITPYRFHMSVGKRFDEKEIKLNVTNRVINFVKKRYEKNSRQQQSD